MNRSRIIPLLLIALLAAGCRQEGEAARGDTRATSAGQPGDADLTGSGYTILTADELERGRHDAGWRRVVQLDTLHTAEEGSLNPEEWEQITAESVNARATHLPLHGNVAGPSVLTAQILLDRALFSPGIIDGRWGKNTEIAVYWFQSESGLRATGQLDRETFERLARAAGEPRELVRVHRLTEEEVEGPFVKIPEDIYDKAELDCLCYESLGEKLAERFHTSQEVLRQLNPGVELGSLVAGSELRVPHVRDANARRGGPVAQLVVFGEGHYLHALDAQGRILYHFPITLGSSYDPSPDGQHTVRSITRDPWWHYQPAILEHVDSSEPDARIPPGPNNAVGVVWMALSIPHYGIHGTAAPETIGYATSAGCVRLTNWDALFLADRIESGVEVVFRDTGGRSESRHAS
jgi:lipoprotein-anchoring transpeptidase ErfK/SrfK